LTRPLNLLIHRRYRPGCERVDELVIEGHVTPEGFTVLHTPGHAPGHLSLHHADAGLLITGDAISHRGGRLGLPPSLFTPNMPLAIESLQKFLKPDYQVACFGHGPPLKEQARERIESFVKSLQPS
ncbi:MAG: MBL fold metallo-hydrolase, partial [Caldilineae bacterium]